MGNICDLVLAREKQTLSPYAFLTANTKGRDWPCSPSELRSRTVMTPFQRHSAPAMEKHSSSADCAPLKVAVEILSNVPFVIPEQNDITNKPTMTKDMLIFLHLFALYAQKVC